MTLLMTGCSGSRVDLDSAEHRDLLAMDRTIAGQPSDNVARKTTVEETEKSQIISLSVDQAIARGLTHNLDAKVAALETLSQQSNVTLAQIKAFPNIEASGGYSARSNDGSSSSRSIITGQQSLEPSISTEQHRRTAALEANWNLLDVALALSDATRADDEVEIARERHTKVMQNVERDVYTAYWRALAWQDMATETDNLMQQARIQIENIEKAAKEGLISPEEASEKTAQLTEREKTFRDMRDRLALAQIELKSMLSLPLDSTLQLTTERADITSSIKNILSQDITEQEWSALMNRPEMREEILKKNMTIQDTRREIIQTIPGAEIFFAKNYDSNKFLTNTNWDSLSAKLVQSLTSLFTLPARYTAAKDKQDVADARRQALAASILAQTRIARIRLESARQSYETAQMNGRAAQRKAAALAGKKQQGFAAGEEALRAGLESAIERMRADLAYADLQEAYASLNNTIGLDLKGKKTKVGGGA